MKRCVTLSLLLLISGCSTVALYDGARRGADEVARIVGDPVVTAGAPVTVILRRVDRHALHTTQTAVELLPGTYRLLVDCRIAETRAISRHALDVEVLAGARYRLAADAAPGLRGCTDVELRQTH